MITAKNTKTPVTSAPESPLYPGMLVRLSPNELTIALPNTMRPIPMSPPPIASRSRRIPATIASAVRRPFTATAGGGACQATAGGGGMGWGGAAIGGGGGAGGGGGGGGAAGRE